MPTVSRSAPDLLSSEPALTPCLSPSAAVSCPVLPRWSLPRSPSLSPTRPGNGRHHSRRCRAEATAISTVRHPLIRDDATVSCTLAGPTRQQASPLRAAPAAPTRRWAPPAPSTERSNWGPQGRPRTDRPPPFTSSTRRLARPALPQRMRSLTPSTPPAPPGEGPHHSSCRRPNADGVSKGRPPLVRDVATVSCAPAAPTRRWAPPVPPLRRPSWSLCRRRRTSPTPPFTSRRCYSRRRTPPVNLLHAATWPCSIQPGAQHSRRSAQRCVSSPTRGTSRLRTSRLVTDPTPKKAS